MFPGLSTTAVLEQRKRFGMNALPEERYRFLRLLARQFQGVFTILLLVAAGVTFMLGEILDGAFILFLVFLRNGLELCRGHMWGRSQ